MVHPNGSNTNTVPAWHAQTPMPGEHDPFMSVHEGFDDQSLQAPEWHRQAPFYEEYQYEPTSFVEQEFDAERSAIQPIMTEDAKRASFFGAIWPTEGHTYFCTFGKGVLVSWNVPDISTFVKRHTSQDLYFGIGQTNKAGTSGQRARRNGQGPHVTSIACLFGDFDGQDFDTEISRVKTLYKTENKAAKEERRKTDYTKLATIDPAQGKAGAWKALQEAESKVGPASFVIDSGGGYQAYWLLDQPIVIRQMLDAEDIRLLFAQWQAFIGADKSAKDLERVYRVPYSYNCKPHYSGGPLLATVVRSDPMTKYNISDIQSIVRKPRQMELVEQKRKPARRKVQGKVKKVEPPKGAEKTSGDHERDIALAAGYLKRYDQARCDVYADWFNVACALKHRFTGTCQEKKAFKLWDEWSQKSKSYDSTDANQKKWASITPTTNPRNFGSLAYWANEDDPNPTPPTTLEALLETIEGIPNRDDLTDKLPDLLDDGLKLSTKELTLFCRNLAKRSVKKGDIGQFRADLKAIRKEKGKLRKGDQVISGRVVRQGHEVMSELFELGYDFRMNQLDDSIEVNGERLTDGQMAEIEIRMDDLGFTSGQKVERTYTAYAYQNSYHPIKKYLNGLTWDGRDHIKALADHLSGDVPEQAESLFYEGTFDNNDGVLYTWQHAALRRWLAGAVAKVYGASQNTMIVLDGPQGIGKSYLSQWLASPMKDYFLESAINTEDKDSLIRLAVNWIWEVAELGATTRKSDREALKNLLTLDKVVVRKAYAKTDMRKKALASFLGTINNEAGFLGDPTGNRRFLVVPVMEIDHGYSQALDPNQIWAQALALFQSGEMGNLTKLEKQIQTAVNRAYTTQTASSDLLDELYMVTHNKDDKARVTEVQKVLRADGFKGGSSQAKREIDRWMTLNSIRKSKTMFYLNRKNCYVGIKYKGERCQECGTPQVLCELTMQAGMRICFKCRA